VRDSEGWDYAHAVRGPGGAGSPSGTGATAAISLATASLEGFVRAAAREAPRDIRLNAVSPPWVTETLQALKMDPSQGLPAAVVAQAYVRGVTGTMNGGIVEPIR
jgi:NAD(P)-dependent dehydrogenase (short-subunit alcohol dehydrogenase family)